MTLAEPDAPRNLDIPFFREDCPCRKRNSPRHGDCPACEAYHVLKSGLPYCRREHKTLWRGLRRLLTGTSSFLET